LPDPMPIELLQKTNFTAFDWGIVVLYLVASLAIGLLARRYVRSMASYIGAGRQVGTWLGVATMTGTELGLVTVMYNAEMGLKGGFAAFHVGIIAGVVTLVVGMTGFVVAPLRREGVLTIPEYYERRFGRDVRILGGIILAGAGILNMGLFLKFGSIFVVGITGMDPAGNAVPIVMTVMLILVLIYTVLGGMISVVITDYVQFVILSFGILATSVLAIWKLGWNRIVGTVAERMQLGGFDPTAEGSVFGTSYVVWMLMAGLVSCAIWPTAVARALAMKDERAVRRQYRLSSISFAARAIIPMFWGICAFVFIVHLAPDMAAHFLPNGDLVINPEHPDRHYAMPIFLGRLLPVGMIGILTAAMIAAFMSTHDSYLLCWSSVITQDIVAPIRGDLSVRARIAITRIAIVAIGAFVWWWGLFYPGGEGLWEYMVITGAIYFTGAGVLLVGGLYWKRASRRGALVALLAGCSAVLGLEPIRVWIAGTMGLEMKLTEAHVGLFSVALTLVLFVLVSLLFPDPAADQAALMSDDSNAETVS